MGDLVSDLRGRAVELRETHISWVFLREQTVLKLKKPVDFGFLDFTQLEQRKRACEAEVVLNTRLAPDVYFGVEPVTYGADGIHRIGGEGDVVDYAVHMRRLRDSDRADIRLAEGRLEWPELESLVLLLVGFHARAPTSPQIAAYGEVDCIARNVAENFAQAGGCLRRLATEPAEREVEAAQLAFLRDHAADFERRLQSGKIKDGHGDLRLEHVYFPEPGAGGSDGAPPDSALPVVIDCIEFNERFRYADVCADIAFLSMDLAFQGHVEHKERFLAAYARESDDYDLYAVVDFYESYRAYVRAKVCALGLASASAFETRERLERDARRYLMLSLAAERAGLDTPRLIAVGGIIASGKSTLAEALGRELAVPVISSDRTRKSLHGVAATERLESAAYAADASAAVYAEVLRRAAVVLGSGRSVIVDASFRTRDARAAVGALARQARVGFRFVECRASEAVTRARLRAREQARSVSDARLELYDSFVSSYEPVLELSENEHSVVDTGQGLERALAELRNVISAR
jgi:aminoglycoside phosphotransferase family enzyme/predicted kinase